MTCAKCGGKMRGKTTHYTDENEIVRMRKCATCGHTVHTLEFEVDYSEDLREIILESQRIRQKYYRSKAKC
jgi:transcriptional regulator NrdR family protein